MAVNFINDKISPAIICLVFLAIACAIQLPLNLNHDTAWLFQIAFGILEGDKIGIDLIEVNPPMSTWICLPPAIFLCAIGGTPNVVFKLFFLILAFAITLGCGRLLTLNAVPQKQVHIFTATLCLLIVIFPGYDFAQREQFAALLTLPYVIASMNRVEGHKSNMTGAVIIGVIAAIGIGMKPYFLCVPIFMEIWLMLKHRHLFAVFRAEVVAMMVSFVIYLGAVYVFAPGYYENVIPDAMKNYGGYSNSYQDTLQHLTKALMPYFLISILVAFICKNTSRSNTITAYFIAAAGFLVAAILQKKGWNYHIYPVIFYMVLAIIQQISAPREKTNIAIDANILKFVKVGILSLLGIMMITPSLKALGDNYSEFGTGARIASLEATIRAQEKIVTDRPVSVFAFITSPRDIHPAVLNTKADWAHNAVGLVYLPAAINGKYAKTKPVDFPQILEVSAQHDREMIAALAGNPPDLIFVHSGPDKLAINDPDFDYLEYYINNPDFAEFFLQYSETKPVMWYRVFERKL